MPVNAAAAEALDPAERLIVALDGMGAEQALALAAGLPQLRWVKVGLELFVAAGPPVVRAVGVARVARPAAGATVAAVAVPRAAVRPAVATAHAATARTSEPHRLTGERALPGPT